MKAGIVFICVKTICICSQHLCDNATRMTFFGAPPSAHHDAAKNEHNSQRMRHLLPEAIFHLQEKLVSSSPQHTRTHPCGARSVEAKKHAGPNNQPSERCFLLDVFVLCQLLSSFLNESIYLCTQRAN